MYSKWISSPYDLELYHHGVKGMKWGVRKRKNVKADEYYVLSTLTQKERDQYSGLMLSDDQYQGRKAARVERSEAKNYRKMAKKAYKKGWKPNSYHDPLFVSLVDKKGDPMGVVIGQDIRDRDTRERYMNIAIAITKKYQGKHVSDRLVKEGKDWFDKHPEYSEIRWYAAKNNIRSQRLAEKSGFKRAEKHDIYDDVAYVYKRKSKE